MPDPYDPPDPGPLDDLQRETERIARALGERAEARAQRNLAEQSSAQRATGERAEQDAERRRDNPRRDNPDARRQASTDADWFGDEARAERGQAERSGARAARGGDRAEHHDRLAARLEADGIDRGLAQTRVRADRSFGAPVTAISGRAATAGGRPAEPTRARTARSRQAGAPERPRSR